VRKLATTSSESCGITTSILQEGRLTTHSYFDGQGTRRIDWPDGALPADGLPLMLREYVKGEVPNAIEVFPSLMASRLPSLEPGRWRVSRESTSIEVPAGEFEGIRLTLTSSDREASWVFDAESPHPLLFHETSEGTIYRLVKIDRLAYWRMNREGDESWWPAELR